MSRQRSKEGGMPHKKAIIVLSTIALILILFFVLLVLFKTDHIEVTGNYHETDEEVVDEIIGGPMTSNTLLLTTFLKHPKLPGYPFIDNITIEYLDRNSIRIRVEEKALSGYVTLSNSDYYFNADGIVLLEKASDHAMAQDVSENSESFLLGGVEESYAGSRIEETEEYRIIPRIEGIGATEAYVGEVLAVPDPSVFSTIASMTEMINKNNIEPDLITCTEEHTWTITCGTVTVLLGEDKHLEEKILELSGILPKAEGLTGVLHLENFDGSQKRIIFDKTA